MTLTAEQTAIIEAASQAVKVPSNMWAAEVEVRRRGSKGKFYQRHFVVRAEFRDISRYIVEDADMQGLETRCVLWLGKIISLSEVVK